MNDRQRVFSDAIKRGHSVETESETNESLPAPDADYTPFGRRAKPEFSLHFIKPAGTIRGFQYAHLDSDSHYTAECITLRFMGIAPVQVCIHGRCLRELYDLIHQHRVPFVGEAARGFAADDDERIVTAVVISPLKESDASEEKS